MSAITLPYNPTTNEQEVHVTGTLPLSGIELILDGIAQSAQAVVVGEENITQRFTVSGLLGKSISDIVLRMPDGYPTIVGSVPELTTMTFSPKFYKITPDLGSECGTVVTVKGTGFGVNSIVNLKHVPSGNLLCDNVLSGAGGGVEILGYGEFTCLTRNQVINTGDAITLVVDGVEVGCLNSVDATACNY